jgi:hypothetical protein
MHGKEQIEHFLTGKSGYTLTLFDHFVSQFEMNGPITIEPTKTMIGISNSHKRIAWITQLGRNFIHVVFPFKQAYTENFCFKKVGQVPGQSNIIIISGCYTLVI